jgi:hypothetical protein
VLHEDLAVRHGDQIVRVGAMSQERDWARMKPTSWRMRSSVPVGRKAGWPRPRSIKSSMTARSRGSVLRWRRWTCWRASLTW